MEQNINKFSSELFNKLQIEKEEELETIEKSMNEKIKIEEEKLNEKLKRAIKEAKKLGGKKKKELVTQASVKAKQDILAVKLELIEDMKNELIEGLKVFTNSLEYEKYIAVQIETAEKEFNGKDLILYIKNKEKFNHMLYGKKFKLIEPENDIIGGFILEDCTSRVRMNNSFIFKLENMRDYIGYKVAKL